MIKKVIASTMLVMAVFMAFTKAVLAYNEPSGWAAPLCTAEKPAKAWLYRVKSLGKGQYQLFWDKADRATSWTIGFGTQPGKYIYGMNSFGNDQSRNLIVNTYSNKKFYFVVKANNGCMPGEWSNEWGAGTVVGGTYVPKTTIATTTTTTTTTTTPAVTTIAPKRTTTAAPTQITTRGTAPITPVVTPAPVVKKGFWEWLTGLFR